MLNWSCLHLGLLPNAGDGPSSINHNCQHSIVFHVSPLRDLCSVLKHSTVNRYVLLPELETNDSRYYSWSHRRRDHSCFCFFLHYESSLGMSCRLRLWCNPDYHQLPIEKVCFWASTNLNHIICHVLNPWAHGISLDIYFPSSHQHQNRWLQLQLRLDPQPGVRVRQLLHIDGHGRALRYYYRFHRVIPG